MTEPCPSRPRSTRRIAAVLTFAVALGVSGAATAPPVAAAPDGAPYVVVVAFDEFPLASLVTPEGRIDANLFPNFARLARLSTWYPRARTMAPRTSGAMPALLSGREPGADAVVRSGPDLFSMLGGVLPVHGERRGECGPTPCVPAPATVSTCRADGTCSESVRSASLRRLIRDLSPSPEGGIWYEHVLLPHQPWNLLPDGRRVETDVASFETNLQWRQDRRGVVAWHDHWLASRAGVSTAVQRHLLQVQYADALIGRLLDRLTATGMLDRSLVVVTADHGEAFVAGRSARALDADPVVLPAVLSVPLFIKTVRQVDGRRDDRPATIADVVPTILDDLRRAGASGAATAIDVPSVRAADVDGVSLLGRPRAAMPALVGFDRPTGRVPSTEPDWDRLTRWRRAFASLAQPRDLYRLGPAGGLVGRAASSLDVVEDPPIEPAPVLRIPDRAQWSAVPASGRRFPAAVVATVDGVRAGDQVLIAVNGVVAGSGPVWRLDGTWRFQCILDPARLRPGANDVRAFLVRTVDGERLVVPIAIG